MVHPTRMSTSGRSSPIRLCHSNIDVALARGVAAVDGQRDADDEAGAWTAKPQHGGGDLFGFAESVDGLAGDGFGEVEFTVGDHVVHHGRGDGAGAPALIRTPRGAYSSAALLVSPSTPCLEAW